MPHKIKTAAASGNTALPQLSAKMLEELILVRVTKGRFENIFQIFKKTVIE